MYWHVIIKTKFYRKCLKNLTKKIAKKKLIWPKTKNVFWAVHYILAIWYTIFQIKNQIPLN